MSDTLKIRGFFRIQITKDGEGGHPELVGDSGVIENTVVNDGFNDYIARLMIADAASKRVSHAALGTGTAPAAANTTLAGEITDAAGSRSAVTSATSSTSKKVRFTATFASSDSFVTANKTIQNVGLFQQSNTNTATIMAGNTYATSQLQTNNNVNITYDLDLS
jgi:hypothetical protein